MSEQKTSSSQEQLIEFQNLLVESVPRAVPLSAFAAIPIELYYNREISTRIQTATKNSTTISESINTIKSLDQLIQQIDQLTAEVYTRRSLTFPLTNYIEHAKADRTSKIPSTFSSPTACAIAKDYLYPLLALFQQCRSFSEQAASQLFSIFSDDNIWLKGNYSSILIDNIILLIFKLTTIERLIPIRKALMNDISQFLRWANDPQLQGEAQSNRLWVSNVNSATDHILQKCESLSSEHVKSIFDIIFNYIRQKIDSADFLYPYSKNALVNMTVFLARFYAAMQAAESVKSKNDKKYKIQLKNLDDSIIVYIKKLKEFCPIIVFLYDFSNETSQYLPNFITNFDAKKEASFKLKFPSSSLDDMYQSGQDVYHKLSSKLTSLTQSDELALESAADLSTFIPDFLRTFSKIMSSIISRLAKALTKPKY